MYTLYDKIEEIRSPTQIYTASREIGKVRTKAPKSSALTAEWLCAGNSAPDGRHDHGRRGNKRRTSVDDSRVCAADIDRYAIQGDT
jgi:hypothetical protein